MSENLPETKSPDTRNGQLAREPFKGQQSQAVVLLLFCTWKTNLMNLDPVGEVNKVTKKSREYEFGIM